MCKSENAQREERQSEIKKAYVRPQLIKHGNVETLTQNFRWLGSSNPTYWPH